MSLIFQREAFGSFYDEARPLLERHKDELSAFPDIPLNVDVDRYREMELLDLLRIYTVRKEHNWPDRHAGCEGCGMQVGRRPEDFPLGCTLIGYAVFIVSVNPHYMTSLQAVEDVLFVAPEHRGGRAGIGLVRFSEAELRKDGVQVVYHHAKLAHPMLGKLLTKDGYEPIETIFAKRLHA